jgi:hypothetical protein
MNLQKLANFGKIRSCLFGLILVYLYHNGNSDKNLKIAQISIVI